MLPAIKLGKRKNIPDSPGVYFFKNARGKMLYIGKAGSLCDRVRSYFSGDIAVSRGPAIERMLREARSVSFEKTDSVLEAVILEAKLIRKHRPKYNVREKDDKSFNYVVITDEDFPRILPVRERELSGGVPSQKPNAASKKNLGEKPTLYGPFPQGGVLKEALRIIRKIFPYRDTCTSYQHPNILLNVGVSAAGNPCFNRQIGLCPGVCTGEITGGEYRKIIRNIRLLFEGRKKALVEKLKREMKHAAEKREFERAAEIRNTIFALNHIRDISLIKRRGAGEKLRGGAGAASRGRTARVRRIEGYDTAHMSGSEIVGVLTVLEDGDPLRSGYRKFKLRTVKTSDDPGALKEILARRLAHADWPLPDLIVVDGGKAQVNAARRVVERHALDIPIVGVVKDERHRPKRIEGDKAVSIPHEREILLANAEAHRFALAFHRAKMRRRLS